MPNPFTQALQKLASRTTVGAGLSSADWASVPTGLRERAFFSARVTTASYVQEIKDRVESILRPQAVQRPQPDGTTRPVTEGLNLASARMELKDLLREMDYTPDADKRGTIEDLSSDQRLNLQLKHNVESAQGYGDFLQGQAEGALDAFPAQELFRAEDREEPRNWIERWRGVGGRFFDGDRMIALKSDPIWTELSAFGTPYPPFDFNSGMWVRDVDRAEAERIGLLQPGEAVESSVPEFNESLEASVKNLDTDMQRSLQESFGDQVVIDGGMARWASQVETAPTPTPAPTPAPAPMPIPVPTPVAAPPPAPIQPAKPSLPAPAQAPSAKAAVARQSPVSQALKLPAAGAVNKAASTALNAIDQVHDDGQLPVVPVVAKPKLKANGALTLSIVHGAGVRAGEIHIRPSGTWPSLTTVHEVGHLLDLEAVGAKGRFATEAGDGGTTDVLDAIRKTKGYAELQARRAAVFIFGRRHAEYQSKKIELWARAYAQFVAEESGDPVLARELARAQAIPEAGHWQPDDFKPVAAEFRKLFSNLKWI